MKREKKLFKNILILGFGNILPKLSNLIVLPIITSILTKKEYGTYDLITTMVSLFLPLVTLQLQASAFRFLINSKNKKYSDSEIITNILFFTLIFSISALFILFIALYKIKIILRICIILYYFFDIYVSTIKQISRGLQKNLFYSLSTLIECVGNLLFVIIFLKIMHLGLYGTVISLIISLILAAIVISYKLKIIKYINMKLISKNILKELVSYSWPLIPNSLSNWIMTSSDKIVITCTLGLSSTAIYSISNKLPHLFNIVQNTFTLAWQENASITIDDDDSSNYYSKMFKTTFNSFTGILAVIIVSTPILFKLLIKGDYWESYNHIPILFMASFFACVSSYLGGIYIAHKKSKQVGITTTIAAMLNLIIDILLIKQIGIYAASLSTLISYIFLAVYRMKNIQKFQIIKFDFINIAVCIISLLIICAISFMRNTYLNVINAIFGLALAVFLNKGLINSIKISVKKKICH